MHYSCQLINIISRTQLCLSQWAQHLFCPYSLFFFSLFAFSLLLGSNQPYIFHSQKKQHISHHRSLNKFLHFGETPPQKKQSLLSAVLQYHGCWSLFFPFLLIKSCDLKANSIQSPVSCFLQQHIRPENIKVGLRHGLKILFSARLNLEFTSNVGITTSLGARERWSQKPYEDKTFERCLPTFCFFSISIFSCCP